MLRCIILFAALLAAFSFPSGKALALDAQQEASIKAIWAKELPADRNGEAVVLDSSEPQVRIALVATRPVHDLSLLRLEFEDISDEGKPRFKTQVLHKYAELKPEQPLIIAMTFYGSIPGYGFSYRDADGTVRHFAIQESGKDGSLELVRF